MTVTINGTGTGVFTDASGNFSVRTATPTAPVTVGRVDSSNEGGQIDLCRASDNASSWAIDVYGNTSTPSFRIVDNVAAAARVAIDSSGVFQFNSGYGAVAAAYGCRAWVNFNGQGTVAIRGSGNVSSITDQGVGRYRINFANSLIDANYAINGTSRETVTNGIAVIVDVGDSGNRNTSGFDIQTIGSSSFNLYDSAYNNVSVFR